MAVAGPTRPTERRAQEAARQLTYHTERVCWMQERMRENTAVLEAYLTLRDEEAATLPDGRRVALDGAGGVEVSEPRPVAEYEQLELTPGYPGEAG